MKQLILSNLVSKLREEKGSTGENTVLFIGLAVVALIVIGIVIAFLPDQIEALLTQTFGKITDFFRFV